jgi:anti-sigma B factor antagonist
LITIVSPLNEDIMKLIVTAVSEKAAIVSFPVDNLDAGNVKQFRDAIQSVTADREIILLDMSQLKFIDSSGLGALLSCLRAMNGKNGQLRLFSMTKPVKALFELVRMHRIFAIFGSREEALEDIAAA